MPVLRINNEKELLLRVAKGDEAAFNALFKHYWPQVYGTSFHLTRSVEMAKDLSQDIFVKLWNNREKLSEVEKAEAYIYTVSSNTAMDYLRKKVFDTVNVDYLIDYFASENISAQQKLEYNELQNALNEAVENLTGNVRDVFKLSRQEGLSHPEIASKLNISVHSSRTYLSRALIDIKEYLKTHAPHTFVLILMLHNQA